MWNSFAKIAEQAKKAAADLDQKITESVGVNDDGSKVSKPVLTSLLSSSTANKLKASVVNKYSDAFADDNDAWDDDENDKLDNVDLQNTAVTPSIVKGTSLTSSSTKSATNDLKKQPTAFETTSAPTFETDNTEQHHYYQGDNNFDNFLGTKVINKSESESDGWNKEDDELQFDDVGLTGSTSSVTAVKENQPNQEDSQFMSSVPTTESEYEKQHFQQNDVVSDTLDAYVPSRPTLSSINDEPDVRNVEMYHVDSLSEPVNDEVDSSNKPAIKTPTPNINDDERQHQLPVQNDLSERTINDGNNSTLHIVPNGDIAHTSTSTSNIYEAGDTADSMNKFQELQELLKASQQALRQREEQLMNKTEQLTAMQSMFDSERSELLQRISSTKEEAKRRIQKAKERVEEVEEKLKQVTAVESDAAEEVSKQKAIVAELRAEGETLARKQLEMEKKVRSSRGEVNELKQSLEDEISAKENALERISKLEADLKETKDNLSAARRGESQAGKLENELSQVKHDNETKAATIMSLEQQIKELKAVIKDQTEELEASKKGLAIESQREMKKIRKDHQDAISELETKIALSERDAALREDSLRKEVEELRKRWQDAVRRADALSIDVQSSSAPLLRQLESLERQGRARATAWAELETKLRNDLEENVIENEKLTKERSDLNAKCKRLERQVIEFETDLKSTKSALEEKTHRVKELEAKLDELEKEGAKKKAEWAEIERLANEGVTRVRSEMTQTVVEAEERYRSQLDAVEKELRIEREKRSQLQNQVQQLMDNAGAVMSVPQKEFFSADDYKPKKLQRSQNQATILAGALGDLDDDDEENDEEDELNSDGPGNGRNTSGSYAALEGLQSRLRVAKVELTALRKSLTESEKIREQLVEDLKDSRLAKEKLPFFEAKVQELTEENNEQALEIQGLQDDIAEVKEMYRTQLNQLLEEKVALPKAQNGDAVAQDESMIGDESPVDSGNT